MIWVLEDRYESPLSIDKKVPVAVLLTSQWRFNDVIVTQKTFLSDFCWKYADFQIFAKNPRKMRFW